MLSFDEGRYWDEIVDLYRGGHIDTHALIRLAMLLEDFNRFVEKANEILERVLFGGSNSF